MHYTMNYAYDFHAAQLVHGPAKHTMNFKPPISKAAPHRGPLDAADLTRRLQIVIAERNARDQNKRRSHIQAPSSITTSEMPQTDDEKFRRPRTLVTDSSNDKRSSRGPEQYADNSLASRFRRRASRANLQDQLHADPAPARAPCQGPYVPQVAASQFTMTTIGDSPPDRSYTHRLSRAALKYHIEGVNADPMVAATAGHGIAPFEQAKALRQAQTLRERNFDRNQFQAFSMPEDLDPAISSPLSKRRSIYAPVNAQEKRASRRKSTGSLLRNDSSPRFSMFHPPLKGTELAALPEAHRVDWTQSDETTGRAVTPPRRPKSASPTESTKGESKWRLRGRRLNSLHKHKDEKCPSPPADHVELPKSPIAALFARLKR